MISNEDRSNAVAEMVTAITDIMQGILKTPSLESLSMMADQLAKGMLATLAMSGMFRQSEQLNAIYRDRELAPFDRLLKVGTLLIVALAKDETFHAQAGPAVDESLTKLYSILHRYYGGEVGSNEPPS